MKGVRQTMADASLIGAVILSVLVTTDASAANRHSCRPQCLEAYGHCYKRTNSRERCQSLLQRCLDGCIRKHRQHHRAPKVRPR